MADHGERPIKVLVVNFSPIVLSGIREALADPEFELVGDLSTSFDIMQAVYELQPSVVLTELLAPQASAIQILDEFKALENPPVVLVLTRYENDTNIMESVKAGAKGFLLEGRTTPRLLRETIRAIADGAYMVQSQNLGQTLHLLGTESFDHPPTPGEVLTDQEIAVLRLVASGYSNREISEFLNISVDTVKRHVSVVIRKLGARSRVHAALLGAQAGIIGLIQQERPGVGDDNVHPER